MAIPASMVVLLSSGTIGKCVCPMNPAVYPLCEHNIIIWILMDNYR